jgi:hypothetical protein
VIDVAAVPDRLEDAVAEPECQDVLDRLLAEVVVDAIELPFVEHSQQLAVQGPGGFEIVSERLFHHDPAPAITVLRRQAGITELLDDDGKEIRGGRKVIEDISASAMVLVHGSDSCPITAK